MSLNYNPGTLEKLNNDFFVATGVNFLLFDKNFKPLAYGRKNNNRYCALIKETEIGRDACRHSDRTLLEKCKKTMSVVTHVCHAGLVDIAMPMVYGEEIIAYIILGQIRTQKNSSLKEKRSKLFTEIEKLENLYDELLLFDEDKIKSVLSLATMMAKYILFEKMLSPGYDPVLDRALVFIQENLMRKISISEISEECFIPKSSLYKLFQKHLGCTVGEYINSCKIEKASELLQNSTMSVALISEKLCFSSTQYFGKVFKGIKGLSPTQFRKNNQHEKLS